MKIMKRVLTAARMLTLPVALVLVLPPAAVAQTSITLEEALDRALERSPAMAQQEQAVGNAALAQRQSLGAFLPSLSASSGASLRSQDRFDPTTDRIVQGSSDSYSAGLSASYTVFAGGRRFADRSAAQADYRAAEARRDDQRNQVAFQTKNLFFAALRQADLLEVARRRVEQAEESLNMVRVRTRVGSATVSDTLRARLEFVNARQAVLTAETSTRAARYALGRQVGIAGPVEPVSPGDLDPSPLGMTEAEVLALAESASPAVIAAEEAVSASNASVSVARAAYFPSFTFSTGYDWANQAASLADGTTSWSLSLRASYPIFNGFQRENNVDRAQFSQRLARMQEDDSRLAAREEADGALQQVTTAEAAIEIAREALAVSQEDLRVVRERYRLGVATILELVTSQIALDQASTDLVTARYDYVLARAQLEAVLGRGL